MRRSLKPHPNHPCLAAIGIEVEIEHRRPDRLLLRYRVSGETGKLRMPPPAAPDRRDRLWEHTCFEIFIRPPADPGYYEFNFAPSAEWAAYRFHGYRSGMEDARSGAPNVETRSTDESYELHACLDLAGLLTDPPWQLGLSAVIEETDGRKSYWALAHPPGKADFHHPDCFALQLPAA